MDQLFPRDPYGRIALALASCFFGPICGLMSFAFLFGSQPQGLGVLESLFLAIVEELVLALFLFFTCGLVWALATPLWLENLLGIVVKKLAIALGLFIIPFVTLAVWALCVS